MQGFSVESKTSGISSSSTLWQDLEAPYKSGNKANMTPRSPRTKPEKMSNSKDLVRKVMNLAGQGASSNSERNWRQGSTCRRGKHLEDSRTDTGEGGGWLGQNEPKLAGPTHSRAQSPPFDLVAIWAIYSPEPRATHQLIRHRPPRSIEERDTISERRGSS
jgi:hypothetical protein